MGRGAVSGGVSWEEPRMGSSVVRVKPSVLRLALATLQGIAIPLAGGRVFLLCEGVWGWGWGWGWHGCWRRG